jgi:hypothetical protein
MRTKIRKYFIAYLSLVLILSNFSFATTLMLCKMSNMQVSCSCTQSLDYSSQGASLSKVNSCCESKTVELSNSNILSIVKNDLAGNFLSIIDVINTESISAGLSTLIVSRITNQNSYHPPNSEIPILNSSLLI